MRRLLCLSLLLCALCVSVSAAHYKKILHTDVDSHAQIQVSAAEADREAQTEGQRDARRPPSAVRRLLPSHVRLVWSHQLHSISILANSSSIMSGRACLSLPLPLLPPLVDR